MTARLVQETKGGPRGVWPEPNGGPRSRFEVSKYARRGAFPHIGAGAEGAATRRANTGVCGEAGASVGVSARSGACRRSQQQGTENTLAPGLTRCGAAAMARIRQQARPEEASATSGFGAAGVIGSPVNRHTHWNGAAVARFANGATSKRSARRKAIFSRYPGCFV